MTFSAFGFLARQDARQKIPVVTTAVMCGDSEFDWISAYFCLKVNDFMGVFYKHQGVRRLQKLNKFIF